MFDGISLKPESDVLRYLRQARELLSDPNKFCQGCIAKTWGGERVAPMDRKAERWCAVGALKQNGSLGWEVRVALEDAIEELTTTTLKEYGKTIAQTNDIEGYDAIMRCFELTIARLEMQAVAEVLA